MGKGPNGTNIPWQVASIEGVQSMEGERVHDLARHEHPAEGASKIDRPTKTVNLVETLAKLVEGRDDAAIEPRRHAVEAFLRDYVFRGLNDLKPPYDSPLIAHFRAADFLWVISRCNLLGVHINGVEVFSPRGQLIEVEIGELDSNDWCVSLVRKYSRDKRSFCATYSVPDRVLNMPPESMKILDQAKHFGSLAAPFD
jgi:hypothetical protein